MTEVVKSFVRADGNRRVEIIRRTDGRFTFGVDTHVYVYDEELREQLEDYEMCWVPTEFGGIFDTEEAAEREVSAFEKWLSRE